MKHFKALLVLLVVLLASCGSSEFKKNPLDVLIRDLNQTENFTIILYDMDVEGTFSKTYRHQYQIITQEGGVPADEISGWKNVSEGFFIKHQNDMGMEIASKKNGKLSKTVAPAGYSNYVGNEKYGQWRKNSDGTSFWEFYGKYMFISNMFRMFSPVPYGYYNDYRSNYYGRRSYYGPSVNGRNTYGTYSENSKYRKNTTWGSKTNNFKSGVNSKVSRSSGAGKYDKKKNSFTKKATRSSSRYSSGSSYRSRGGGFGK